MSIITATNLASFEGVEEPVVRYFPGTGTFEHDYFQNIECIGEGRFRMMLRYRAGEWWDGDRDTCNTDRQRAEVKGLGPHPCLGDTFVYGTTWRSNPELRTGSGFCHIFQLKAANDEPHDLPLVVVSLLPETGRAALRYTTGTTQPDDDNPLICAGEFAWKTGEWQTLLIRIKPSATCDGELQVTVNGVDLTRVVGLDLRRPKHSEYRPKWGFYRATADLTTGEDFIEHANVTAAKL